MWPPQTAAARNAPDYCRHSSTSGTSNSHTMAPPLYPVLGTQTFLCLVQKCLQSVRVLMWLYVMDCFVGCHCWRVCVDRIIRSTLFEGHVIIGMANVYYVYNGLLCTLLVLHCIWFYLILRMVYYFVFKGQVMHLRCRSIYRSLAMCRRHALIDRRTIDWWWRCTELRYWWTQNVFDESRASHQSIVARSVERLSYSDRQTDGANRPIMRNNSQ